MLACSNVCVCVHSGHVVVAMKRTNFTAVKLTTIPVVVCVGDSCPVAITVVREAAI